MDYFSFVKIFLATKHQGRVIKIQDGIYFYSTVLLCLCTINYQLSTKKTPKLTPKPTPKLTPKLTPMPTLTPMPKKTVIC